MRILHIFTVNELKFSIAMIENARRDPNNIHHFYIQFSDILNRIEDKADLIINVGKHKLISSIINKHSKEYDYFFVHGFRKQMCAVFIRKSNLKKIVWRTWGGDIGYPIEGSFLKRTIKKILNRVFIKRMNMIKLIGVANPVDEYNLKSHGISNKTMRMPYHDKNAFAVVKDEMDNVRKHDGVNVMVGHSGYPVCNHYEIIKTIKRFFDDDIRVFLVLSYGDPDYIERLKKQIKEFKTNKIIIISDFMDQVHYNMFLNSMDIAIFDGDISYALGNISKLLFYGKKIYLCDQGIIACTFKKCGIPFGTIGELKNTSFVRFKETMLYTNGTIDSFIPQSYERNEKYWNEVYRYLNCND